MYQDTCWVSWSPAEFRRPLSFTRPGTGPGAHQPRARRTQSPAWEPALRAELNHKSPTYQIAIFGSFWSIILGSCLDHFGLLWDYFGIVLDYFGISVDHCRMSAFIHHDCHWRHGVVLQFTQMMTNPFNDSTSSYFDFTIGSIHISIYKLYITHYGSNI